MYFYLYSNQKCTFAFAFFSEEKLEVDTWKNNRGLIKPSKVLMFLNGGTLNIELGTYFQEFVGGHFGHEQWTF